MRAQWEADVGTDTVAAVEQALRLLVGDNAIRLDSPQWTAQDL
jgi:hypothetical protein